MRHLRYLSLTIATIFTLCAMALTPASAASKPPPPPPPVDTRILIKAINAANSTVDIEYMRNKSVHTYKIDDLTAVKVSNTTSKFADIKVGMKVDDSVERDNDTLDSITVETDHTPAPSAPKKK
jgi:hypothetical protein